MDKVFLMIPEFRTQQYDYTKAKEDYNKIISDDATKQLLRTIFADNDNIDAALEEAPSDFKEWFNANKEKYKYETPRVVKVKYNDSKSVQENNRAARNNMLIDIIHGILTNPDTAEKFHNPGNFDKAKLQARITEIITTPEILQEFQQEFNLNSVDATITKILDISRKGQLNVIDSFLKDYKKRHNISRSQLTVDTFIYNHTQNMTGGALIGMYANNTTMQAKYQHSKLALKDDYTFIVNGRKIQSLHDVTSGLGERISSNCAQFSAASVDNVKDPVLAKLLQNTKTANITGFMLRSGMSIEEISLMFAQPLVRQCILDTGDVSRLDKYLSQYLQDNKLPISLLNVYRVHNYSSEELLRNILDEENSKKNIVLATCLMMHIIDLSQNMSNLTQISRADSPKGAINNTIGGAKMQIAAVKRYMDQSKSKKFPFVGLEDAMQYKYLTPDMSINGMRGRILGKNMPMLQAFYSLGIELGTSIIGNYFTQINEYTDDLIERVLDNADSIVVANSKMGTKVVETLYKDIIQFGLTKTQLFGDDDNMTFEEKRDYYLKEFPAKYLQILKDNPDIKRLELFKKIAVKNGKIILARSARMRQNAKDSLMRDMDSLLYMGPEAQELARDLFMYAFYENGFSFGPNTFGSFFSTNFINAFPEVVTALRTMSIEMRKGTYFDEFLPQFYANNAADLMLAPTIDIDRKELKSGEQILVSPDGKSVFLPSRLVFNTNSQKYDYKYIFIQTENPNLADGLYVMTSFGDNNVCYTPAPVFQTKKYNANMTAIEMLDYDAAPNVQDNNLGDPFAGLSDDDMYDMQFDDNFDDMLSNMESQDYNEAASQQQLQKPLC